MRKITRLLKAYAGLFALYFSPVTASTWNRVIELVRERFPSVRQLSTEALAEWLGSIDRPAPMLIDARTRDEYDVSHLRGARHFADVREVERAIRSKSVPIVVYCSMGYRSSAFAERLQRAGFSDVWNLEGSIFAWANEGRPVFRESKELRPPKVHPFSRKWGKLLDERCHSDTDSSGIHETA